MQDAVDASYSFAAERIFISMRLSKIIIEILNCGSIQHIQLNCTESRLDMVMHMLGIIQLRHGLNRTKIVSQPNIQPFTYCHFRRFFIGAIIDRHSSGLHFFPNLFLRFARKRFLNLFSSTRIMSNGKSGFPVGIDLPIARDSFLSDCASSLCSSGSIFSCHIILL